MKLANSWALGLMCSLVIMEIFSSCFKFCRSLFWHIHMHVIFGGHITALCLGGTHTLTLHRRVKIRALH